jgi:hypothetical protein
VEIVRRRLSSEDGYVFRKRRVQRRGDALGRRAAFGVKARHLAERVDTGVGPPGDGQSRPRLKHLIQSGAELTLDRSQPRLGGPAAKAGAVVLEGELEPRRYWTGAAASAGCSTLRTAGVGGT